MLLQNTNVIGDSKQNMICPLGHYDKIGVFSCVETKNDSCMCVVLTDLPIWLSDWKMFHNELEKHINKEHTCRSRFSASYCSQCCSLYCKVMTNISTYMPLTLARLCGEWQLVSGNCKAQGTSGGKYEAQIVIFCILAAVNRFSWISRKAESRWGKLESRRGKSESRWRNQKAVEESGKPLKKIEFHVRKIGF